MTITGRNFEVKVNGTEFSMGDASPTALEILALAKTAGGDTERSQWLPSAR